MTHEEAFLEAICQTPDDDAPRLIFADWLEEHGQPERAEFIRIQCELERVPDGSPRWYELASRASALRVQYEDNWLKPLSDILEYQFYRRGFLDFVCLKAKDFLEHADALFRLGPIEVVSLDDAQEFIPALAAFAPMSRVSVLNLGGNDLGSEEIRVLGSSPHLNRLVGLNLMHNKLDSEAVAVLQQAPFFSQLRSLNLAHNSEVGATAIEYLVDIPGPISLRELNLDFTRLGASGVQALTASRAFYRHLTTLSLTRCGTTAAGARALAHAGGELTSLRIDDNPIGDDGVRELAGSPALERLTELDLRDTELGSEAAAALARSTSLQSLSRLTLSRNRIGSRGARDLASSPNFSHLSLLNLAGNEIGDDGAKALASSPHLARLNTLFLQDNGLRPWGLRELIMSPHLTDLYLLDLENNGLGDVGAQVIARWCRLPNLATLSLNSNRIGDLGVRELADSPHLDCLRYLDLTYNDITAEGKQALRCSALHKRLVSLRLDDDDKNDH